MKAGILKLLTIHHQIAPIAIREQFNMTEESQVQLMRQMREVYGIHEAIILNTCNRFEIYYIENPSVQSNVFSLVCSAKGLMSNEYFPYFRIITHGEEAIYRLFRVAMGLESQILGDLQIIGQVKNAYQLSVNEGFAGPYLHRLLHTVFYGHKKVHQETQFKSGAASASFNTVKLVNDRLNNTAHILIIGAGQMGSDCAKNLNKLGYRNITICNRNTDKALELSHLIDCDTLPFHNLNDSVNTFDAVINTVPLAYPLHHELLGGQIKLLVDLSAPRGINELVGMIIPLFNIDAISSLKEQTMTLRTRELPKVESIIRELMEEIDQWEKTASATNSLKQFKEILEQLRQESINQYIKNLDKREVELIDELTQTMVNKIVKLPALKLKTACQRYEAEQLNSSLYELFHLEKNLSP